MPGEQHRRSQTQLVRSRRRRSSMSRRPSEQPTSDACTDSKPGRARDRRLACRGRLRPCPPSLALGLHRFRRSCGGRCELGGVGGAPVLAVRARVRLLVRFSRYARGSRCWSDASMSQHLIDHLSSHPRGVIPYLPKHEDQSSRRASADLSPSSGEVQVRTRQVGPGHGKSRESQTS